MQSLEVEILEDTLDDDPWPTRWDLEVPIDLVRDDLDDDADGDIGLRALFEYPERILRPLRSKRSAMPTLDSSGSS